MRLHARLWETLLCWANLSFLDHIVPSFPETLQGDLCIFLVQFNSKTHLLEWYECGSHKSGLSKGAKFLDTSYTQNFEVFSTFSHPRKILALEPAAGSARSEGYWTPGYLQSRCPQGKATLTPITWPSPTPILPFLWKPFTPLAVNTPMLLLNVHHNYKSHLRRFTLWLHVKYFSTERTYYSVLIGNKFSSENWM